MATDKPQAVPVRPDGSAHLLDSPHNRIRVLLAHNLSLVRAGLVKLIDSAEGFSVTAQANDGASILMALERQPVDLLIVDFNVPAPTGVELIGLVRLHHPLQRMLVTSRSNALSTARAAFEAGAHGYISQDSEADLFIQAAREVTEHGYFVDPRHQQALLVAPVRVQHSVLSARELQVLSCLVAGLNNRQIAQELFLSDKTVSTHKANIMRKLNLGSMVDLVRYASEHACDGLPVHTLRPTKAAPLRFG